LTLWAGCHVAARVQTKTNKTPGPDTISLEGCKPAERGNVTLWSTAQLPTTQCDKTLSQLVSWSLTSLFSTNMAISETKGQGWKVIHTQ